MKLEVSLSRKKVQNVFKGMSVIQVNIYKNVRKIEAIGTVKDAPKSGSPKTSKSDKC